MTKKLLLLPFLLVAACASSDATNDGDPSCVGKCDGVAATPLFQCAPAAGGEVACDSLVPAGLPFSVEVSVFTADPINVNFAKLTDGQTFRGAAGKNVIVQVGLGSTQRGLFKSDDDSQALDLWSQSFVLDGSKAQRFDLPFDVWQVELDGDAFMTNAQLDEHTITIAPWETFLGNQSAVTRPRAELPTFAREPLTILVLAARGATRVSGKADFCTTEGCSRDAAFEIAGPGRYRVAKEGLSRATAPAPNPNNDDADMTPALPTPNEEQPDLAPATPVSDGCGGDAEPQCKDANGGYVCDEGHVYSTSDSRCHVCGGDNERQCRDANGSYVCDEGYVYSSSDSRCHVCGGEGERQCRDASGAYVCDEGHVYSSSDAFCHVCGGEGERQCRDASGAYVCDEGFVYRQSSGRCHECGGEGQWQCQASNGSYGCDEGFVVRSSDGKCHAQ